MKGQDKQAELEFQSKSSEWAKSIDHLDPKRREKELELLGIAQSQHRIILDAGCGGGTYGLVLARNGNKVIGVDISQDSITAAHRFAEKEKLDFSPLKGDIERMPFRDEFFDICVCGFILHHLPGMSQTVSELYRVLKPGGIITIIEPNGSNPIAKLTCNLRLSLFKEICEKTGFASRNERAYPHKNYIKALQENGFRNIRYSSQRVPRATQKTEKRHDEKFMKKFITLLLECRELVFISAAKLLPQPYKWPTLYITTTKTTGNEVYRRQSGA